MLFIQLLLFSSIINAQSLSDRVHFGKCALKVDPDLGSFEDFRPSICFRGNLTAEAAISSSEPRSSELIAGDTNVAALFTSWISYGLDAQSRLAWTQDDVTKVTDHQVNYSVVQIGNNSLHRHRVTLGHVMLPFGIHKKVVTPFYQQFVSEDFWKSPKYGGFYTYDNFLETTLQFGFATETKNNETNRAASARYMVDFAALEGTRLSGSMYSDEKGERRFGLGMLNINGRGDEFHFEVIRSVQIFNEQYVPFRQLVLFGYRSPIADNTRWRVLIQDEMKWQRMAVLNYEYQILEHFFLDLGLGFRKSENPTFVTNWFTSTGISGEL